MNIFGSKVFSMTIRKRIIFFVVFPVVIATFLLNYYLTLVRLDDADTTLELRGKLISGYLAIAAEYSLFTGDKESLKHLANFTKKKPDIAKIVIYDRKKQIITQTIDSEGSWPTNSFLAFLLKHRKPISITEPVYISGFNILDFQEGLVGGSQYRTTDGKIIGWVEIVISPSSLIVQQQRILTISVVVALISLMLGILLSLQIERLITRPIQQLVRMVQFIRKGQYKMDRVGKLSGELGMLEKGLTEMAISLSEKHEQLREKVASATIELRNSIRELELNNVQLEESQREVTKASLAKEEFLARMSHEIRTPMNAVIGYATLLKKTQLAHNQQEYTRIIDRAAHQLLTVIDDILVFTKLESGAVSIENIQFDLQESLEDVITMLSQSAHDQGLELVLLIYSDVPVLLLGDPIRINQILINLLNNAIKFTLAGSIVVHVEVDAETEDKIMIRVSVDDTGPGIAESQKEQLFEEFTQADSTITRRFGGTGLGLPIAKKLAVLMHGNIGVENKTSGGSNFWFRVECGKTSDDAVFLRRDGLLSKKVLVYDENQFSARAIRNNLLKWECNVFTVRSMQQSYKMFSATHLDGNTHYDLAIFGLSLEQCTQEHFRSICRQIRDVYTGPLLFLVGKEPYQLSDLMGHHSDTVSNKDSNIANRVQFQRKPIPRRALYNVLCTQLNLVETKVKVVAERAAIDVPIEARHVLIVEDNKFNRDLVSTLLRAKGYYVYLAEDAQQGMDIVNKVHLDLVLMDIHLPDMSGLDAAKKIRGMHNRNNNVPIIALTADVFLDKKSTLSKASVNDCIVKPIDESVFWQTLNKYIPCAIPEDEQTPALPKLSHSQRHLLNSNINTILSELSSLIVIKEQHAISAQIHQLKGIVGYYQLHALSNIIGSMEKASHNAEYNKLPKLVRRAYAITSNF